LRRSVTVPRELAGSRLDQALAALADGLSRRAARVLIERGSVYLDGLRCRTASRAVAEGARISVEEGPALPPEAPDVAVLWREGPILVMNKPAGVPFAPTRAAAAGTVLHALARRLALPLQSLHPVHRLDTGTSGAVLVALEAGAAAFLGEALREGRVAKSYNAWVAGEPEGAEGSWSFPLGRPAGGVVRVDPSGREARTLYRVLAREGEWSFLELRLLTGRTHQIRVHCAAAGVPILGDAKYGRPDPRFRRPLLHSRRLVFPLPGGGEAAVEAPLPADMVTLPAGGRPSP
jgi:RluA family pseudouridine synthase